MKRKITVLTLCAMLFALGWPVWAQQQEKLPRIGFVSETGDPFPGTPNFEAFRQGLRDLGYVEGKNILIDFRSAEGKPDRIPGLVAELVQLKVDAIVSHTDIRDPRSQAGDQDDSDCHGDSSGSGCHRIY